MKETGARIVARTPILAMCFSTSYLLSKCGTPVCRLAEPTDVKTRCTPAALAASAAAIPCRVSASVPPDGKSDKIDACADDTLTLREVEVLRAIAGAETRNHRTLAPSKEVYPIPDFWGFDCAALSLSLSLRRSATTILHVSQRLAGQRSSAPAVKEPQLL